MRTQYPDGYQAWVIVTSHIIRKRSFRSVSGITYDARLFDDGIAYKGGERSNGEEEVIRETDFVAAFNAIRDLPVINTNTIKTMLPGSLYRKRTPFIGLLFSAK